MERGRRRGWTEKETKSGEFDKRGWRESLSCRPYLNSNPVEDIFRSLLTRIFGHPGNIPPARLYRILSGTFLSGFQRTYPPGCSLSSKQYYSCSLTLKTEEKNWCSPHLESPNRRSKYYGNFFLLLNVGKIPTKYSFHQFCSYYGLAGKSKQFSFFLGSILLVIYPTELRLSFLLLVVANWERCFTLSLSFAFFKFGPKLPKSSLAYLSSVNRGL